MRHWKRSASTARALSPPRPHRFDCRPRVLPCWRIEGSRKVNLNRLHHSHNQTSELTAMRLNLLARQTLGLSLGLTIIAFCNLASAADWPRFHGPDGRGVSLDKQPLPATWSETENLKWKAKLPGPGSSSPIVIGGRVVLTCWTGYGTDPNQDPGEQADLRAACDLPRPPDGQGPLGPSGQASPAGRPLLRPVYPARLHFPHASVRWQADLRLLRQDGRFGVRSGRQATLANQRRHRIGPERLGHGVQPHRV